MQKKHLVQYLKYLFFFKHWIRGWAGNVEVIWPYSQSKLELNLSDTKSFFVCTYILLFCTLSQTSGTQV